MKTAIVIGARWESSTGTIWEVIALPRENYVSVSRVANGNRTDDVYCWRIDSLLAKSVQISGFQCVTDSFPADFR
jgi:hypothetical protein